MTTARAASPDTPGASTPARRGRARSERLLGLVLVLALAAVAYLAVQVHRLELLVRPISGGAPPKVLVVPHGKLSELERSTTQLFREAAQSVVHITTLDIETDPFKLRVLEVPRGTGSGFLWDDQGDIVTNLHVVRTASTARVTLYDHSVWPAQLVGTSPRHDLAVLKVPGAVAHAKALPVGASNDLLVGQSVLAIGSPFGLDYTLSTGVISGLGREIAGESGLPIRGVIQTDAAINPGNSGGPLLDSSGRLIGINTAILSPSGVSAGIGFAVPVDTVARVVPQLIQYGHEVRPMIGVELADDDLVRRLGMRGALVLRVVPNSPADHAGVHGTTRDPNTGRLRLGDVIVGVDDRRVDRAFALYGALDLEQPGSNVQLHIMRDGEPLDLAVEVGSNVDAQ